MLSVAAESRLVRLLDAVANGEKQVERQRQSLADNSSFNTHSAFSRLDSYRDDYLTSLNLQAFLRDNGVPASSGEAYDLLRSFAKYPSHRLSYSDFRNAVLPAENEPLRDIAGSRPSYSSHLPISVERGLSDLLSEELRLQRDVRDQRDSLRACLDFSANAAFRDISANNTFIYPEDLRALYRRAGRVLLPSEEEAIMRRLDQDADGKLSFGEFYDAVSIARPDLKAPDRAYASRYTSPKRSSMHSRLLSDSPAPRRYESPVIRRSYYESPSVVRRSYYESPRPRRIYEPLLPYRRSYYYPLSWRYYDSPSLRRSYYERLIDLSPSRRTLETTGRGSGLTQPYEYSPLRGYTAIRENPGRERPSSAGAYLSSSFQAEPQAEAHQHEQPASSDPMLIKENDEAAPQEELKEEEGAHEAHEEGEGHHHHEHEEGEGHHEEDEDEEEEPVEMPAKLEEGEAAEEQKDAQAAAAPLESEAYARTPERQPVYYSDTPPREQGYSRGGSPVKSVMEASLAQRLKGQMSEDMRVEYLKEELSLKADFNLPDVFAFFDIGNRGYVTAHDLRDGLNFLGHYATYEDCLSLLQKFDSNHDGVLDSGELEKVFLPSDIVTAGQLQRRAPFNSDGYYARKDMFTPRTESMIADVAKAQMTSERAAEHIRQRLRLEGSTMREAFLALDKQGKGHISKWDMSALMDDNYLNASRNELNSFMERFDKDKDGKVTYDEFVDEMLPKSPPRVY